MRHVAGRSRPTSRRGMIRSPPTKAHPSCHDILHIAPTMTTKEQSDDGPSPPSTKRKPPRPSRAAAQHEDKKPGPKTNQQKKQAERLQKNRAAAAARRAEAAARMSTTSSTISPPSSPIPSNSNSSPPPSFVPTPQPQPQASTKPFNHSSNPMHAPMLSMFSAMHSSVAPPSHWPSPYTHTTPPSLYSLPPALPPAWLLGPPRQPQQTYQPPLPPNARPPAPPPDLPLETHSPPQSRSPLRFTFKPPISPLALPQPPADAGDDHAPPPPDYRRQVARAVSDLQAEVETLTKKLHISEKGRRVARSELKAARVQIQELQTELEDVEADKAQLLVDRNREAGFKKRAQNALGRATIARDQAIKAQAATEKELTRVQADLARVEQDLCFARAAASKACVLKPLRGQARQDVVEQLEKLDGYCALGLRVGRTINAYTQQKRMTLRAYYSHLLLGHEKEDARRLAIKAIWPHEIYQSKKRQFNNWLPEFERDGDVAEGRRGRNQQFVSPIQDADSQQAMQTWLEAQKPHTVTAAKFRGFLNNEYLPILSEQGHFDEQYTRVSLRTAGSWLNSLGWVYGAITKGVYTDGHDAPETVVAREEYLESLRSLSALSASIDQSGKLCLPNLKSAEAKSAHRRFFSHMPHAPRVVFVYHDESTIRSQDGVQHGWFKAGTHHLMQKTLGRGLMLSDFLTMDVGFLTAKDPAPGRGTKRAGIKWDVKSKGKYFDADALNEQWLDQALPTFNHAFNPLKLRVAHFRHSAQRWSYLRSKLANVSHKRKHQLYIPMRTLRRLPSRRERTARLFPVLTTRSPVVGVWIFDCATSHTAFAEDALRATKMNVGEGGAQPILRDGWFINDAGTKVIQKMSKEVDGKLVPKGAMRYHAIVTTACLPTHFFLILCRHAPSIAGTGFAGQGQEPRCWRLLSVSGRHGA